MPLTRLLWVSRKMAVVEVERTNTENERKQIRNKSSQSKENEAKRRFLCMVLHSLEAQWPNEREQSEQKKHRRRKMGRKKMKQFSKRICTNELEKMYLSYLWKKWQSEMRKKGLAMWVLMGIDIDTLCVHTMYICNKLYIYAE